MTDPAEPPLSWPFLEEAHPRRPVAGVFLRRYPYPYKAAVTISNDTDRMRANAFDDLHDFVNGTGETPYGPGLGLEMSDSFWLWSERNCFALFHAAPFEKDAALSPDAERIIALAKGGVLDMLHSFGEWLGERALTRDDIARGLDLLDRHGVKPRVWVNHGGGPKMTHQIEGRWARGHHGDDPAHESYCHDLLRQAGFLYFSHAVFAEVRRFGEHRVYRNQTEFDLDLAGYDFQHILQRYDRKKGEFRNVFGDVSREDELALRRKLFNKVLIPDVAQDGEPILFFKRFRGPDRPSAGNFVTQINHYALRDLVRRKASVVVYQHFGVKRPAMSDPTRSGGTRSTPPVLDDHNRTAFEYLADYNRNGEVWVPTQERFLDFMRLIDFIDFDVIRSDVASSIIINHIACPVEGDFIPTIDDINGLSFLLPEHAGEFRIFIGEREVTAHFRRDMSSEYVDRPVLYSPYARRSEYISSAEWKRRSTAVPGVSD